VVKPKTSLSGKCHIVLSDKDKEKLTSAIQADDDDDDEPVLVSSVTQVQDSDDEEVPEVVKDVVKDEVKDDELSSEVPEEPVKQVQVEDAPKKKRIVKK
jgi:hypothetical protein